jgi:hypothetical protein
VHLTRVSSVGALLVALLVPSIADAKAPTSATLTQSAITTTTFKGRVTSPKPQCRKARTVRLLFRYGDGTKYGLGTQTTNRKGRFKFTNVAFDGTGNIFAKVRSTAKCRAATSNKIFIGGT